MRVAVIHGGTSTEHEVSLASGRGIIAGLRIAGHQPVPLLIDREGLWHTGAGSRSDTSCGVADAMTALLGCDVAIPALHGLGGEDGTVQGLLEMLGVPYVGSGVRASALCLDKALTKAVVGAAGVPVATGLTISRARAEQVVASADAERDLLVDLASAGVRAPVFIKPVHGGSSIGVSRLETVDASGAFRQALAAAGEDAILIESEIIGLEVDLPVLQLPDGSLRVGPSLHIQSDPDEPFFSEAAKYTSTATMFTVPAPLSTAMTERLAELALTAFRALGCAGLARVDFFVTPDRPILNEVNTFPGFTEHSQFPQMWAAAGLSYPDLVDTLVTTARATRPRRHLETVLT